MTRAVRVAVAAAAVGSAIAGCGSSGGPDSGAVSRTNRPAADGVLDFALSSYPRQLDPLLASDLSSLRVSRQLYEPLVSNLSGPYGDVRRRRGLALSWSSSSDRSIWSFNLRRGVRFQNGEPFNASAVLANAARWRSSAAGRRLLPGLLATDAPSNTIVRFVFNRGLPDLPRRLAEPQLGIVSPGALPGKGGRGSRAGVTNSGTGPFVLVQRQLGKEVLLAPSASWWGTRYSLGPALDEVRFKVVPAAPRRVAMLRRGTIQVADALPAGAVASLRNDPLVTAIGGPAGEGIGLERSVRGITSPTAIESLSDVWLTRVGSG